MKILYVTDFSAEGNSGKNKATREKVNALGEVIGRDNLHFLSPGRSHSFFDKTIGRLLFDYRVAREIFTRKDHFLIIQRAVFLPCTLMAARLKKIKVFAEFHADFREEIEFLNKSKLEKILLHVVAYFYNLNYDLVNGIIFNHPYLKAKFDTRYRKPSMYSYNGANFKEFVPKPKLEARRSLSIPTQQFVYLFLGSVSQWHGVDLLIDVFNQERIVNNDSVFLYIVGVKDNEYTRNLKSTTLNRQVIFIDAVDTETASSYINASDVCLLPVKHIRTSPGSPLKLYDYISCGKPVLTQRDLAGYADEVENHQLGLTTDFTDPQQAASDLLKFMDIDLEPYGVHNRYKAEHTLNWKSRMTEWVDFLNNNK